MPALTQTDSQDVQICAGITTLIRSHVSAFQPPKFSNTFPKAQLDGYVPVLFWLSTPSWTPTSSFFWNKRDETMAGADQKTLFLKALVVTVTHSSEPGRLQDLKLGREVSSLSDCYENRDSEVLVQYNFFLVRMFSNIPPRQFPAEGRLLQNWQPAWWLLWSAWKHMLVAWQCSRLDVLD